MVFNFSFSDKIFQSSIICFLLYIVFKDLTKIETPGIAKNAIFLVLDGLFEMPIRCATKNTNGEPTYIKKLYDIAYDWDVPNKKVDYDRNVADSINNGLFRKRSVEKYMKTNKFKKPTLVQKSENGTLVLKNDIQVKIGLVKNDVPIQHQSFYIDKTK